MKIPWLVTKASFRRRRWRRHTSSPWKSRTYGTTVLDSAAARLVKTFLTIPLPCIWGSVPMCYRSVECPRQRLPEALLWKWKIWSFELQVLYHQPLDLLPEVPGERWLWHSFLCNACHFVVLIVLNFDHLARGHPHRGGLLGDVQTRLALSRLDLKLGRKGVWRNILYLENHTQGPLPTLLMFLDL